MSEQTVEIMRSIRIAFVALLLAGSNALASAELPQITLAVGSHKLIAEVASTDASRQTGLMHRRMMPENRGMLFIFRENALHGMWMMNTFLPLSVAFVDAQGAIINIEDMEPHTRNSHHAKRPAKYALEMNQGWFAKRGIKAGDRLEGLEKAGAAR